MTFFNLDKIGDYFTFYNTMFSTLGIISIGIIKSYIQKKQKISKCKKKVQAVLRQRQQKIDKFLEKYKKQIPDNKINEIKNMTANELVQNMKSQKINEETVVLTFLILACKEGVQKNYVCDINPEETLSVLQIQIQKFQNIQDKPPFYCLPFAVKNSMNCIGFLNDFGCVNNLNYVADFDSDICKIFKQLGGIPICTTNIPQCYQGNTQNEIWGLADNIYDFSRQAGGSSGGSALMVSNKLIPIALGSDLTGSIKIPCLYSGCYGFVPTFKSISNYGIRSVMDGNLKKESFQEIAMQIGPIANNIQDIQYFCENIYLSKMQKFKVEKNKKLKFGYVTSDQFCEITAPQKNVIQESVQKLQQLNYSCIEITDFDRFFEITYINLRLFLNMFNIKDMIKKQLPNEIISSNLDSLLTFSYIPDIIKGKCLQSIVKILLGQRSERLFKALQPLKLNEYINLVNKRNLLIDQYYEFITSKDIDIVLTPVTRYGVADGLEIEEFLNEDYVQFPNDIHTCSGVVPIRLVNSEDLSQEYQSKYKDSIAQSIKNNLKNSEGNPIGIQVIGLPNQDQQCLEAMNVLQGLWNFKK